MLQGEREAGERLKKSQMEAQKQTQVLELSLRDHEDKLSLLENSKMELEQQLISLQAALEAERRDRSQGSETIADLQGEFGD